MELTTKITGMITDKGVLKLAKVGDELTINNCRWRVRDVQEDRILIWKYTGIEDHVFNDNWSNVYEGSDIQKYLQNEFRGTLPEELLNMVSEEGFFLLSLDQVKKYLPREIDRICCDKDGDTVFWWTSTPNVGNGYYVRHIHPSGYVNYNHASNSYGVAPACWLNL